jgi:hypothetical protein
MPLFRSAASSAGKVTGRLAIGLMNGNGGDLIYRAGTVKSFSAEKEKSLTK